MVALEPGLYVRIQELDASRAPQPLPLSSGFSKTAAYRVIGLHRASETSETYFILINDRDEVWFISDKHTRAHAIMPETRQFSFPLGKVQRLREG